MQIVALYYTLYPHSILEPQVSNPQSIERSFQTQQENPTLEFHSTIELLQADTFELYYGLLPSSTQALQSATSTTRLDPRTAADALFISLALFHPCQTGTQNGYNP